MYAEKKRSVIQMSKKQYRLNKWGTKLLKNNRPLFDWANDSDDIVDLVNEQDKMIKELEEDLNDALNRIEERSIDIQLLKKENENQSNILEDFMLMLNRLQANPDDEILQLMSKDMLRMMGKDIMGDSE